MLPTRIVLVGSTGAGKSTVGPILATRAGYRFVDLDEEVVRLAGGRSIPAVFREGGEAAFRHLEARATALVDEVNRVVIATGGGWMAQADLRDRWPDAVRVWLRVSPPVAVARLGRSVLTRPMLDPSDPVSSAQRLLEVRLAAYQLADLAVETENRTPGEVAEEILFLMESGQSARATC